MTSETIDRILARFTEKAIWTEEMQRSPWAKEHSVRATAFVAAIAIVREEMSR